jgi:uncharacterized protein YjdB
MITRCFQFLPSLLSLTTVGLLAASLGCPTTPDPDAGVDDEAVVSVTGAHSVVQNGTLTLSATTVDGSDDGYTWSSGSSAVATVSSTGVVTGVSVGETIITATGNDSDAKGTHAVVVTALPVAPSPSVSVLGNHRVEVGATLVLTATTVNGTDASYTWASSNIALATVANGTVTALAPGEFSITATGVSTNAVGTFAVVAVEPVVVADASVTVSGPFYVAIGNTAQLSALTLNATDATYTWSSSDDTVATVSDTGLVSGIKAGPVTITATGDDSAEAGSLGLVVTQTIPNFDAWQSSGHADVTAEAFTHWNEDGAVPVSCARCHSRDGYRDYIGDDGTAFGVVDNDAPLGSTVDCQTCHNPAADELSTVTFPSGVTIDGLGAEVCCMTCH